MVIEPGYNLEDKSKAPWWVKIVLWFVIPEFWITIGDTTYCPNGLAVPSSVVQYDHLIVHERVHIKSWHQYGIVGFPILYLLVPCPVIFAYFRWKIEREAYLVNIVRGDTTIERAVNKLWSKYCWPWPKSWMTRWFKQQIA